MDNLTRPIKGYYKTFRSMENTPSEWPIEKMVRKADLHHGIKEALAGRKRLRTTQPVTTWPCPKDSRYLYVENLDDFPHYDVKAESDLVHTNDYCEEYKISPLVLSTRGPKSRKHKKKFYFAAIEIGDFYGESVYMIDTIPNNHMDEAATEAQGMAQENIEAFVEDEQEEDRRYRREQATEDAKILIKEIKAQSLQGQIKEIIYGELNKLLGLRQELCK